jgi:hypothetical protein
MIDRTWLTTPPRSPLDASRVLAILLLLATSGPAEAAAPAPARAATPVAVVGLDFRGDVPTPVRRIAEERLGKGLAGTGLLLLPAHQVRHTLGTLYSRCDSDECRRAAAGQLACRYVVSGTVRGDDGSYDFHLWIGDGYTGRVSARVRQRCDICGLKAVGEKMELAASALAAKLRDTATSPARVAVQTDPPGATIFVDGDAVGPGPRDLELVAGPHELAAEAKGHIRTRLKVTAVAGVQERVLLRLLPMPPTAMRRTLGWVTVAAGIATLGAGIALFAINGQTSGCADFPGGKCAEERHTIAPASALTVLGVVAIAGGGILVHSAKKKERASLRASTVGLAWDF